RPASPSTSHGSRNESRRTPPARTRSGCTNSSNERRRGMKTRRTRTMAAGLLSASVLLWGVGFVPLAAARPPLVDRDGDGLSDRAEHQLGTDTDNPDTEGDGRAQGEEGARATAP